MWLTFRSKYSICMVLFVAIICSNYAHALSWNIGGIKDKIPDIQEIKKDVEVYLTTLYKRALTLKDHVTRYADDMGANLSDLIDSKYRWLYDEQNSYRDIKNYNANQTDSPDMYRQKRDVDPSSKNQASLPASTSAPVDTATKSVRQVKQEIQKKKREEAQRRQVEIRRKRAEKILKHRQLLQLRARNQAKKKRAKILAKRKADALRRKLVKRRKEAKRKRELKKRRDNQKRKKLQKRRIKENMEKRIKGYQNKIRQLKRSIKESEKTYRRSVATVNKQYRTQLMNLNKRSSKPKPRNKPQVPPTPPVSNVKSSSVAKPTKKRGAKELSFIKSHLPYQKDKSQATEGNSRMTGDNYAVPHSNVATKSVDMSRHSHASVEETLEDYV